MTGFQEIGFKAFLVLALVMASYAGGYLSGFQSGKNKQLADTVEAFRKRGDIDATVHGKSDFELCVAAGGLSAQCEQLRGLDAPAEAE